MSGNKYSNLFKTLTFRKGMGGANAREMVFVRGEELAGFELNFIVGVYDTPGDWAPNRGAHAHPFDEILLFFGYDPQNLDYLGSDLNISMGKEGEQHRFNTPTVVAMPRGVPHNPLVTDRVYSNFGHFHLALSANYAGTPIPKEGTTDGHQYDSYFKPLKAQKGPQTGEPCFFVNGNDLLDIKLNFRMGLFSQTGKWAQTAHSHAYDEVMIFFGHNVQNLSYLGAEISLLIGPEQEEYSFNVPTAVAIPRGLKHFPLSVKKIDQPFRMMQVGLNREYIVE
jgi:hypothetical protein